LDNVVFDVGGPGEILRGHLPQELLRRADTNDAIFLNDGIHVVSDDPSGSITKYAPNGLQYVFAKHNSSVRFERLQALALVVNVFALESFAIAPIGDHYEILRGLFWHQIL
jgi:hypothetical protein